MITRAGLIAVGCVLASLTTLACDDGSSKQGGHAATTAQRKAPPKSMLGTVLPPGRDPSYRRRLDAGRPRFVRQANVACEVVGRAPLIPPAEPSLARRADHMSEHASWVGHLRRRLMRVRASGRVGDRFHTYLVTLKNESLLDARTARAARAGDQQAVNIGLSQNEINRDRRSAIARRLGLSDCLRERSG